MEGSEKWDAFIDFIIDKVLFPVYEERDEIDRSREKNAD